ncbi:MAG: hypothetical protein K6V73_08955 [Firmicutes bacterium]|nr:hypothetical protein [Bacillota bacterium]
MRRLGRTTLSCGAAIALWTCVAASAGNAASVPAPLPVAPPVSAADFRSEPAGTVPVDGDGRIPNPATPDGTPLGSAPACDAVFVAGPTHSADAVNAAIARTADRLTRPYTICLSGVFRTPIRVWGKWSAPLLTIESQPGTRAVLTPGTATLGAVDANEFDGVAGAVSIVDSRGVEVRDLTIEGYRTDGTAATPAGIYVEVRGPGFGGAPSACFAHGDRVCGDIFLIDNRIRAIADEADRVATVRALCGNASVDAFGIEVESYGRGVSGALQHVAVVDNRIADTRTGQSETLAISGDVTDFLVAGNRVGPGDNIGIDVEGWYDGTSQANHGVVEDNAVADIDTRDNRAYGVWDAARGRCAPLAPNAAGIYDDGAAYLWIRGNLVANTDQGISLDTETPGRWTDHILVSGNTVRDTRGTALGVPSWGPDPRGFAARSKVAGHAYDAFYVDAFAPRSSIYDVYAYGNVFRNASAYFGALAPQPSTVVAFGGRWHNVVLWDNTVAGGGGRTGRDVLVAMDDLPTVPAGNLIDCTDYEGLGGGVNFLLPGAGFSTLGEWQRGNGHGWDRHSAVGHAPRCAPGGP